MIDWYETYVGTIYTTLYDYIHHVVSIKENKRSFSTRIKDFSFLSFFLYANDDSGRRKENFLQSNLIQISQHMRIRKSFHVNIHRTRGKRERKRNCTIIFIFFFSRTAGEELLLIFIFCISRYDMIEGKRMKFKFRGHYSPSNIVTVNFNTLISLHQFIMIWKTENTWNKNYPRANHLSWGRKF